MGIVNDLDLSFMTTNNYILLFNQTYLYAVQNSDITGLNVYCHSRSVLCLGGGLISGSTFIVIGCALCSQVLNQTVFNTPIFAGGAYWYFTPDYSIGFSPTADIAQLYGDVNDPNSNQRLSWHLNGDGGYRAGSTTADDQLMKYIYIKNRKKFYFFKFFFY